MAELKIGKPSPPLSRTRTRELYERNSWATRSAPEKTFGVKNLLMEERDFQTGYPYNTAKRGREPEWSYATTFARGGIEPGHGLKGKYSRDPHTGVWHKVVSAKPWFRETGAPGPASSAGSQAGSWTMLRAPTEQTPSPALLTREKVMVMVPMNNVSVTIKRQPQ
mmetsp:Transcript_33977/g.78946  ORF Transcript_33977/g.78946 Transcript_33977/m.78946 type:complete len:165 (-) Transcript_33977:199-693(-)